MPGDHSAHADAGPDASPPAAVEQRIFSLLDERKAGATICPSEVARSLAGPADPWRDWMPRIRTVAQALASEGRLRVTRRGQPVDATAPGGPIRLGRPMTSSNPPASSPRPAPVPAVTPDGRYFVVRGRLWRMADPSLAEAERDGLVRQLMDARRALRGRGLPETRAAARAAVHRAKVALGERGAVWWSDGAPDENRKLVRNSSYAAWGRAAGVEDAPPPVAGGKARAR